MNLLESSEKLATKIATTKKGTKFKAMENPPVLISSGGGGGGKRPMKNITPGHGSNVPAVVEPSQASLSAVLQDQGGDTIDAEWKYNGTKDGINWKNWAKVGALGIGGVAVAGLGVGALVAGSYENQWQNGR